MSIVLLAASAAWLGSAAKTNRDLLFYWLSQQKHREGGIFENAFGSVYLCLRLKKGKQLSGTLYKGSTPSIALN